MVAFLKMSFSSAISPEYVSEQMSMRDAGAQQNKRICLLNKALNNPYLLPTPCKATP